MAQHLVKREPDLIGRSDGWPDDDLCARSPTRQLISVSIPFDGPAIGLATVAIFESTNPTDEGGLVIRCDLRNDASAFKVHAVATPNGADIHIAGDAESKAFLATMHQAISQAVEIFHARDQLSGGRHSLVQGVLGAIQI